MANKVYQIAETDITWLSSGGTNALTLTSLSAGAGRQGAQHDFGTSARPIRFAWRAWVKANATPTVGQIIEIYAKTSDGTNPDNSDGTTDAAVSAAGKLLNLVRLGAISIDQASTTPTFVASGIVELPARYFQPVVWNAQASVALSSTGSDHGFKLTPIVDEIQ